MSNIDKGNDVKLCPLRNFDECTTMCVLWVGGHGARCSMRDIVYDISIISDAIQDTLLYLRDLKLRGGEKE